MASWTGTLPHVLVLLQVAFGVCSSYNVGAFSIGMGLANEMQDDKNNILSQAKRFSGIKNEVNYDLDDIIENQIPPPPTEEDMRALDDLIRSSSLDSYFNDGPLEDNDIGIKSIKELKKAEPSNKRYMESTQDNSKSAVRLVVAPKTASFGKIQNIQENKSEDSEDSPRNAYLELRGIIKALNSAAAKKDNLSNKAALTINPITQNQEQPKHGEAVISENQNEVSDKKQPCNCDSDSESDEEKSQEKTPAEEVGCGEGNEANQERPNSLNKSEGEDRQIDNGNPKIKIILALRNSNSEEINNIQPSKLPLLSSPDSESDLNDVIPEIVKSIILKSLFKEAKNKREEIKPAFPLFIPNGYKESNMPGSIRFPSPALNKLNLLRHLTDIMKEKSAVDASERGLEIKPLMGNTKFPLTPKSKLLIVKRNNLVQLPFSFSPNENDGNNIKNTEKSKYDIKDVKGGGSTSDEEPIDQIDIGCTMANTANDDTNQWQPDDGSQDVPTIMKSIIKDIKRPSFEKGDVQPMTTQNTPEEPAEEKKLLFFRPLLAPFII